jgi:hypothetical protein
MGYVSVTVQVDGVELLPNNRVSLQWRMCDAERLDVIRQAIADSDLLPVVKIKLQEDVGDAEITDCLLMHIVK